MCVSNPFLDPHRRFEHMDFGSTRFRYTSDAGTHTCFTFAAVQDREGVETWDDARRDGGAGEDACEDAVKDPWRRKAARGGAWNRKAAHGGARKRDAAHGGAWKSLAAHGGTAHGGAWRQAGQH